MDSAVDSAVGSALDSALDSAVGSAVGSPVDSAVDLGLGTRDGIRTRRVISSTRTVARHATDTCTCTCTSRTFFVSDILIHTGILIYTHFTYTATAPHALWRVLHVLVLYASMQGGYGLVRPTADRLKRYEREGERERECECLWYGTNTVRRLLVQYEDCMMHSTSTSSVQVLHCSSYPHRWLGAVVVIMNNHGRSRCTSPWYPEFVVSLALALARARR